jgi:hypothetical protein
VKPFENSGDYHADSNCDIGGHGPLCALGCFAALTLLVFVLLLPGLACAQAQPEWTTTLGAAAQTQKSGGATKIVYSGGDKARTVARAVTAAANDSALIAETVAIETTAGAAEITAARAVGGAALRRAIGGALAGSIGGPVGAAAGAILAASALKDYLDGQGIKQDPNSPTGYSGASGSVQPIAVPADQYCGIPGCFGNLYALLTTAQPGFYTVSRYGAINPDGLTPVYLAMTREQADYNYFHPGETPQGVTVFYYRSATQDLRCPDYTPVPSGGCPGAGPGAPLSAAEIGDKLAAAPMPANDKLTTAVNALVSDGSLSVPASEPSVSGPPYVESAPRPVYTSTVTAGDTAAQTETIRTPLSYSGSTVTEGTPVKTSSTVTTKPDGSSSTKTETATMQKPDVCKAFPWLFICSEIGEPDKTPVPTGAKAITFDAENLNLPSACPADISMGRLGSISMASACTTAGNIRGLVIAAGAVAALMICIAAVRGAS